MDLISPFTRSIDVIGRESELSHLHNWLNGKAAISVRVLTGPSGFGKTRLAVELIEQKSLDGWRAGFLQPSELARFLEQHDLSSWQWNAPVLVVVDHASTCSQQLNAWLTELADSPVFSDMDTPPFRPLRVLLLERKATRGQGWWEEVVGNGTDAAVLEQLLDPPRPIVLSPLNGLEDRRAILRQTLERLNCGFTITAAGVDGNFDRRLSELTWGGVPLLLMMAAASAARAGFGHVLALSAAALVFMVVENELARIRNVVTSRGVNADLWPLIKHVIAVMTLRRGVKASEARELIEEEAYELGYALPAGAAPIWSALSEALADPEVGTAALEPDMVSEALLVAVWNDTTNASDAIVRAYSRDPGPVVETIIRTCQDFLVRGRSEPLAWLNRILNDHSDIDGLMYVAKAMPDDTVELREVALHVSEALVEQLRTIAKYTNDGDAQIELGMALINLSNRLYWTGRQGEALIIAREGATVFRKLVPQAEMYSQPHLAVALNNISARLADHGLRSDALDIAQEAVALHRKVAARSTNVSKSGLARALNNLSLRLADMGHLDAALAAIEETVASYRELNTIYSGKFRADVAGSLINLASMMSKQEQKDAAVYAIEESVTIFRELVAERPDAYREYLGGALNVLTPILADNGRESEALGAIAEAIDIFRDLSGLRSQVFGSNLAMSLHNYGILLGKMARKNEGIEALEESVSIRRELAASNPTFFGRELAASLRQLAVQLVGVGRVEDAVNSIESAVGILIAGFLDKQAAYAAEIVSTVHFYYRFCQETGYEPNAVLLGPLAEWLPNVEKGERNQTEENHE